MSSPCCISLNLDFYENCEWVVAFSAVVWYNDSVKGKHSDHLARTSGHQFKQAVQTKAQYSSMI